MTVTEHARASAATFVSTDPATGRPLATHPIHDEAAVDAAVVRARAAAAWWRELGFAGRARRLQAFRAELARRADELAAAIHAENGKPTDDALIEVVMTVDHLGWAARHAERIMRPRRVRPTLLAADQRATLEYVPVGVVGVIGPWNYPLFTPMGSIGYALAAGNAVVFKPSELTPGIGVRLAELFAAVVDEAPVLQVVTGLGETGHALAAHPGVDVLAFTGSPATGRKVLAAAAANLTKVVLECGGNDPLLVDADADLSRAAEAALWGGCANAGQTCAGVERVYVHEAVYDDFLSELVTQAGELRVGADPEASYGPMTMPGQLDVVRRHLEDALARGARAVVGGPESIRPPFVDPVVLTDVPADSALMVEETFGPIVPVVRVRDMDEAVAQANATPYGLGASVWSRRRGQALASRLATGMVSVNSVLRFASVPALPFGGRGSSGYGRVHGADGLKEFTRARAVTQRRVPLPVEFASFRRPRWLLPALAGLTRAVVGRRR